MEVDRSILVRSVRGIAAQTVDLSRRIVGASMWPVGSMGEKHLSSEFNVASYGDFPIVREAVYAAMLATMSGADHALAWASVLTDETATVATATLARGALEGLAKAHYLLRAPDTADLVARHIAVTLDDLKFPLRHSKFQDHTGRILDNDDIPRLHREIAAQLHLKLEMPSVQDLIRPLLSAGMQPGQPADANIYSQLSGAAHAATSALGMYLDESRAAFYLPSEIATEQAGYLFAGLCVVAEGWLDVFDADQDERGSWRAARRAAESHLSRLI